MNEPLCKCSVCKEPLDLCPHCRDYKPASNKLCHDCYKDFMQKYNEIQDSHIEKIKQLEESYCVNENLYELKKKLTELKEKWSDDATDETN
jgi:hypothetical protein